MICPGGINGNQIYINILMKVNPQTSYYVKHKACTIGYKFLDK